MFQNIKTSNLSQRVSHFLKCVYWFRLKKIRNKSQLLHSDTSSSATGGDEVSAKIKRESSSLEASQAACKDTAVDRRLDSENSETIEVLSSALHADPHVSIRASEQKWRYPPQTDGALSISFVSVLRQCLPQIEWRPSCFVLAKKQRIKKFPLQIFATHCAD